MTEQELCLALMRADTEQDVVGLLTDAGYWDDYTLWRYFGDNESNYSSIGNQQSEPVAALIEKLVNSVDARLVNACLEAKIDPESSNAPDSIRAAVAQFFEEHGEIASTDAGRVAMWPQRKTLDEAEKLTLTATGKKTDVLSLTISDRGEGQTPDELPNTFLSLHRNNKLRTPFVQGKFNMGGTGALLFCSGEHRLQLILSRRNPALVHPKNERDHHWGLTVVRREPPSEGIRSSVFTYLAPFNVTSARSGQVLSFAADSMPIFPVADKDTRDPYARQSEYGSLVKLYDYQLTGTRSNIVSSGGGLLRRVDFGMPEMALPIRVYECRRSYRGHAGSFSTNALGIVARLDRDKSEKLEPGFPVGQLMRLAGREIRIRVYALKGSAEGYRNGSRAVIYSINGQTHATHTTDFFRRKKVGLSPLADSLVVVVDCSDIDGQRREDMFMNSRDRLRATPLSAELEAGLEQFLHGNASLRELRNRRREEEIAARLDEAEPLATALSDLVNDTPGLSQLLGGGPQIQAPFPPSGRRDGGIGGTFVGKRFPTYFHHRKRPDERVYERAANIGSSVRLSFETDAEDDYFHRDVDRGVVEVDRRTDLDQTRQPLESFNFTGPSSGISHLTFDLPDDAIAGDLVYIRLRITDPSRLDPFELEAELNVAEPVTHTPGTKGKDTSKNTGRGSGDSSGGLALPVIVPVREADWGPPRKFDEYSAVDAVFDGDNEDGTESYTFFVNYDNRHLLAALKKTKRDAEALRAQFVYSLVLYSMALLMRGPGEDKGVDSEQSDADKERTVRMVTRNMAGFVLPTLEAMSALSD